MIAIDSRRRPFFFAIQFVWLAVLCNATTTCLHAADAVNPPLMTASVVDDVTGKPISEFQALAGTSPLDGYGWQWQPHTIHVFHDGQMQWPPVGLRGYDRQVLRVEAKGYMPYQSPIIAKADKPDPITLEIRLAPDSGVVGRVSDPSGEPAADAEIAVGMAFRTVAIRQGRIVLRAVKPNASLRQRWEVPQFIKSDADGRFTLPVEIAPAVVVVTHPNGVAVLDYREFLGSPQITLQLWGEINGRVQWSDDPGAGEKITLIAHGGRPSKDLSPMLMVNQIEETTADSNGRFTFRFVPPGQAQLSRDNALPFQHVGVAAGKPTEVVFGGRGRPVVGRLTGRDSWQDVRIRIAPNAPRPGDMGTEYDSWPAYQTFLASPAGKHYMKTDVPVQSDGSFRIDGVLPEHYQLFVTAMDSAGKPSNVGYAGFQVETIPGGQTDEPFDLGTIETQ
jgi:hypothetical protein